MKMLALLTIASLLAIVQQPPPPPAIPIMAVAAGSGAVEQSYVWCAAGRTMKPPRSAA